MKAKGVRDIDPQIKIVKNRIFEVITTIFESHGLLPLETPVLERWETLSAKYGAGEGSDVLKETFKLTDQGEGIDGVVGSIPFPNPSEALHHVWNHILRY